MYLNIDFYVEEFIDGYFSGTLSFADGNRRIILDFGYDAEFKQLQLRNCNNPLYNSFFISYETNEISDIYCNYAVLIVAEIQIHLLYKYCYVTPKDEY